MDVLCIILIAFGIIGLYLFSDDEFEYSSLFCLCIYTIGLLAFLLPLTEDHGYKQGQIDCINGIVKYKLKENLDKTKEWVEIKESK